MSAEVLPVDSADPEAGARLRVMDAGPGIPEGERERIFEPYYRPSDHHEGEHGGVGLGLSLVREIARHHGGDVRYEPRFGGGSIFEVVLGGGAVQISGEASHEDSA